MYITATECKELRRLLKCSGFSGQKDVIIALLYTFYVRSPSRYSGFLPPSQDMYLGLGLIGGSKFPKIGMSWLLIQGVPSAIVSWDRLKHPDDPLQGLTTVCVLSYMSCPVTLKFNIRCLILFPLECLCILLTFFLFVLSFSKLLEFSLACAY